MVPLVILAAANEGMSAATSARTPSAPVVPSGVASTWLAVWPVAAVTARVPLAVTGLPETDSQDGTLRPTLLTEPTVPETSPTQFVPLYISIPLVSLLTTKSPVAGEEIASRCVEVMRGIRKPLVVELRSASALGVGLNVPMPIWPVSYTTNRD